MLIHASHHNTGFTQNSFIIIVTFVVI